MEPCWCERLLWGGGGKSCEKHHHNSTVLENGNMKLPGWSWCPEHLEGSRLAKAALKHFDCLFLRVIFFSLFLSVCSSLPLFQQMCFGMTSAGRWLPNCNLANTWFKELFQNTAQNCLGGFFLRGLLLPWEAFRSSKVRPVIVKQQSLTMWASHPLYLMDLSGSQVSCAEVFASPRSAGCR